ncbi:MAG: hypothetical protein GY702_18110, partial [Desulfobulbaceae bacterium]|nr:hypothetical protein [Desulfobulbaceae bacterium]
RMTFALGGGPTYVRTEGGKDEWQPNGYMKFTNNIEHGQLTLGATAGVEQDNFSGTNQQGPVDYWQVDGRFSYDLTVNTTTSVYALYRDEEREDPIIDEYNIQRITAGADVRYNFLRWYYVSAAYTFTNSESERIQSDYDEHRLYLSLGVEKSLFSW